MDTVPADVLAVHVLTLLHVKDVLKLALTTKDGEHPLVSAALQVLSSLRYCTISQRQSITSCTCLPPATAWALARYCPQLRHIRIDCSTYACMSFVYEALQQLPSLRRLALQHAQQPLHLPCILAACPHLETLEIMSSALDLKQHQHQQEQYQHQQYQEVVFPVHVRTITLFWCRFYNCNTHDLLSLFDARDIQHLDVIGVGITDDICCVLPSVEYIDISNTSITNRGLLWLAEHSPLLRTLVVSPQGASTTWECGAWTPGGLQAFRDRRPGVVVKEQGVLLMCHDGLCS